MSPYLPRGTSTLPSAEQPEPKSEVFDSMQLVAVALMSAVSSRNSVALPAPTP